MNLETALKILQPTEKHEEALKFVIDHVINKFRLELRNTFEK